MRIGDLRRLVKDRRPAFVWDPLADRWQQLREGDLRPGLQVLLPARAGGYATEAGWDPASREPVAPLAARGVEADNYWAEPLTGVGRWVDLAEHTRDVETELATILCSAFDSEAPSELLPTMAVAARGHDVAKALIRFQECLLTCLDDEAQKAARRLTLWAKSERLCRSKERNPRHELASALALLQSGWLAVELPEPWAEVALFLVAAHHGRARVTVRPWPGEDPAQQILGVRGGEILPEVRLDALHVPATELRLDPLRMGDGLDGASWATRTLGLRNRADLGPFRLAHLEALLRAADWRASRKEGLPDG